MKLYFNIYLSITFPIATLVCIFYDFTKEKGLLISVLSGSGGAVCENLT